MSVNCGFGVTLGVLRTQLLPWHVSNGTVELGEGMPGKKGCFTRAWAGNGSHTGE